MITPRIPRQSKVEGIERTASTLKTQKMPLSVISSVDLNLDLVHTNNTSGGQNTLLAVMKSITKFELVLDGQDNIISCPFYHLYYQNYYDDSKAPYSSIHTTNSTAGTSTVHVTMPHIFPRGINPGDGLLDARGLSTNVAHVNWAGNTLAGANTIDSGSVLNIDTNEYTGIDGPISTARHELAFESRNLDKTGEITINLPSRGTNQYYRIWLYTFASGGTLSDVQIDNIKLQTRSFVYIDKAASRIQRRNQQDYSITYATGVYILDATTMGLLTERIDARDLPELTLKVNSLVTDGEITIVYEKAVFA